MSAAAKAPAGKRRRLALLAGLGVALVVFVVLRNRGGGGGGSDSGTIAPASGSSGATGDTSSSGGTDLTSQFQSFTDAMQQRLDQEDALIGQLADAWKADSADIRGQIKDLGYAGPYDPGAYGYGAGATDSGYADAVAAASALGASGQTQAAAPGNAKATAAGFVWTIAGKQTVVTAANKQAFISELVSKGVSPATWAANHPVAAQSIGVSATPAKNAPVKAPTTPAKQPAAATTKASTAAAPKVGVAVAAAAGSSTGASKTIASLLGRKGEV